MSIFQAIEELRDAANACIDGADELENLRRELEFERSLSAMRLTEIQQLKVDLAYWRKHAAGELR